MKDLRYLNKYFLKYKYRLLLGVLFVICSNIFAIIPAQLVRKSFDSIQTSLSTIKASSNQAKIQLFIENFDSQILIYGLLILAMALMKGVFLFFMRQTIIVMSRLIEYDLKNEIYAHYQSLSLGFYRQNNTGDLMNRISEDVSKVRMYIGPAIMYGLNLIAVFTLVISYMLSVNVKLTVYSLAPLPVLSILIYFVSNKINQKSTQIQESLSSLSTFTQEAFSGIRVIKAFAREKNLAKQMEIESDIYRKKSLSLTLVNAFFAPLVMALIGLSVILTVYIGGLEVQAKHISTGNIAEFIMYVFMLTWPVTSLGWTTSLVQRAAASQKRINEFLHTKDQITSIKNSKTNINGNLEFKNVSLTYPDSGILALDNISFSIPQGNTLGILGTTGSGKSTIANLIARMYDPSEGVITINNCDYKDINPQFLRSHLGYVPQDVFLFSDSIKNNIAFGKDQITEEEIIEASKKADLYENIIQFTDGFETILGERGITLSGGQKQRLSIARALVKKPSILILDDSLSAVDTQTEQTILENLKQEFNNRTSIIISHRVSTLRFAHEIIVLDKGKIIEKGSHEELIRLQGAYFQLHEKQNAISE